MKRTIIAFLILGALLFVSGCSTTGIDSQESDSVGGSFVSQPRAGQCPFGFAEDEFPGKCPRYVDQNHDGICDLSYDN